jgi:integration host factor subunit beta
VGRNPKSGEQVMVPEKSVPHFKPGKELRERVDLSASKYPIISDAADDKEMDVSATAVHRQGSTE